MGQVATTKRWDYDTPAPAPFPKIVAKRPQPIGIGFEWEIQNDYHARYRDMSRAEQEDEWDYGTVMTRTTRNFAERYRFYTHDECNATEFCSPIAYNLETIKAVGRKLIQRAAREKFFDPDNPEMAGIHVHTSLRGGVTHEHFKKALLMLNRESSADFVWNFSRRDEYDEDYSYQAKGSCWDAYDLSTSDAMYESEETCMMRLNQPCGDRTLEYRLWNATHDRLLPALEFAHACTKYVGQHEGDDIPYLKEMKDWLFKQSGYKLLKSQPEWAFVV